MLTFAQIKNFFLSFFKKKETKEELINRLCDEHAEDVQKYMAWIRYEKGFTGHGTSLLDKKPDFDKPELPEVLKQELDDAAQVYAKTSRDSFRKTCMEVLGEDPNDWT